MLDEFLKWRFTKREEQGHFCGGSVHLVLLDPTVIQVDDGLVPVKRYPVIKSPPVLLHGSGHALRYGREDIPTRQVCGVE